MPVPAGQQAAAFPAGDDLADGLERGAGDIGNILAPQRKFDPHAVAGAAPGLVEKPQQGTRDAAVGALRRQFAQPFLRFAQPLADDGDHVGRDRSEELTSELQSLMRISYAVFCLKKKKKKKHTIKDHYKSNKKTKTA